METILKLNLHIFTSLKLLKGGMYLLINSLGLIILGFIFWWTVTKFYNTTVIGVSTGIIPLIIIIGIFSKLGLDFSFLRFISNLSVTQGKKLITFSIIIGILSSLIVSSFFYVLFLSQILNQLYKTQLILILGLFIISATSMTIGLIEDGILIGGQYEQSIPLKNLLISTLRIPLLPLLQRFGIVGVVAAWGVPSLISTLFGIVLIIKYLKNGKVKKDERPLSHREFIEYSLGNYVLSILQNAPGLLLPPLVLLIMGVNASAAFYFSWMIASSLQVFPFMFSSVMVPMAVDHTKRYQTIMNCIRLVFVFLIPTSIGLFIFAPSILGILLHQYPASSISILRILIISSYGVALNTIFCYIKRVEKVLKPALLLMALLNVITFGLGGYYLIHHRLTGLVYVWMITNTIISMFVILNIYQRHQRQKQ